MSMVQKPGKWNLHARTVLLFLIPGTALLGTGCNQGDLDRLERVGKKARDKVVGATKPAQGKLAQGFKALQTDSDGPSLEQRVTARLEWDTELVGAKLQVLARDKAIELRGTVKTGEQKKRALDLTTSTTGVEKVIDGIKIVTVTLSVEGRSRP